MVTWNLWHHEIKDAKVSSKEDFDELRKLNTVFSKTVGACALCVIDFTVNWIVALVPFSCCNHSFDANLYNAPSK